MFGTGYNPNLGNGMRELEEIRRVQHERIEAEARAREDRRRRQVATLADMGNAIPADDPILKPLYDAMKPR